MGIRYLKNTIEENTIINDRINRVTMGVYCIKNIINNKVYIGSSNDILNRWRNHKDFLNQNKHINKFLQEDWDLYGEENFECIFLKKTDKHDKLTQEQFYIMEFNSSDRDYGYNINKNVRRDIISGEFPNIQLINNVKTIRESHQYTTRDLEKISGISRGYISSIETNKKSPSIENAYKLAIALECDIKDLFIANIV